MDLDRKYLQTASVFSSMKQMRHAKLQVLRSMKSQDYVFIKVCVFIGSVCFERDIVATLRIEN